MSLGHLGVHALASCIKIPILQFSEVVRPRMGLRCDLIRLNVPFLTESIELLNLPAPAAAFANSSARSTLLGSMLVHVLLFSLTPSIGVLLHIHIRARLPLLTFS